MQRFAERYTPSRIKLVILFLSLVIMLQKSDEHLNPPGDVDSRV